MNFFKKQYKSISFSKFEERILSKYGFVDVLIDTKLVLILYILSFHIVLLSNWTRNRTITFAYWAVGKRSQGTRCSDWLWIRIMVQTPKCTVPNMDELSSS